MPFRYSSYSTGIKRNMDGVLSPVLLVPSRFAALAFEPRCRDDVMQSKWERLQRGFLPSYEHCKNKEIPNN